MHESRLRRFVPIVALMGAAFASVSLFHYAEMIYGVQVGPSFCNINAHFNCDAVNRSQYSQLFGVPIASYGLAFYLSLLVLSFAARDRSLLAPEQYYRVLYFFSALAVLVSIVLFCVAEFAIGTLCLMCVGVYVANLTLFLVAHGLKPSHQNALQFFSQGFSSTVRFPACLVGNKLSADRRSTCVAYCFGALVLIGAIYFMPEFLYAAFLSKKEEAKTNAELYEVAFKDWDAQIAVEIPFDDGGAAMRDYAKGTPGAPIRIDEFADLECSACRMFYRGFEEIYQQHKDKIHFIFHNYPLDRACNSELEHDMHMHACYLAQFARCAGEQDKFWQVTDYLFNLEVIDDPSKSSSVRQEVEKSFELFGLDREAMSSCMLSPRVANKIEADLELGRQLGVSGTPSLWLNGKKITVNHPLVVKMLIERLLGKGSAGQAKGR